jgi:hypothetical protein
MIFSVPPALATAPPSAPLSATLFENVTWSRTSLAPWFRIAPPLLELT